MKHPREDDEGRIVVNRRRTSLFSHFWSVCLLCLLVGTTSAFSTVRAVFLSDPLLAIPRLEETSCTAESNLPETSDGGAVRFAWTIGPELGTHREITAVFGRTGSAVSLAVAAFGPGNQFGGSGAAIVVRFDSSARASGMRVAGSMELRALIARRETGLIPLGETDLEAAKRMSSWLWANRC